MKIKTRTKIICDICGKDISWNMRNYIQVKECVGYTSGIYKRGDNWDICSNCADEMKDYIRTKIKQESEGR